ncbi:MAG: hypothetical protein ACI9U2_000152 [Bradymonadia bacterium]|jgi:hypothetical protein
MYEDGRLIVGKLDVQKKEAAHTPSFGAADAQAAELRASPVQAQGAVGGSGVQETAAQGVAGSGGALPHLDAIQASFGQHDVSNVQAHVGGAAGKAAEGIGAQAYATGDAVAFKDQPSVHLAAHEAAHVVQQRAGVHLKGGVGEAGDAYEQHADAVADLVVQGKSAEGLLNQHAGSGGSPAVQKKEDEKQEDPGKWASQAIATKDTFFDLVMMNQLEAGYWGKRAEGDEPPPASSGWETALGVVGGLVLGAALGGVGGALAGHLAKGAKFAATAAINAAVKLGEDSIKAGLEEAIAKGGTGKKAALFAYCYNQEKALLISAQEARKHFWEKEAGDFNDQKLTIAQMASIEEANIATQKSAGKFQSREMLVGWMSLLAGKTETLEGVGHANNVEKIHKAGILRLTIAGKNDRPTRITAATVEGLNPELRADLTGQTVGSMRTGGKADGQRRKSGIDLLVTTSYSGKRFQVSSSSWAALKEAGKAPSHTRSARLNAVFFSFFAERSGKTTRQDSDKDMLDPVFELATGDNLIGANGWPHDLTNGADAGRYFLDNIRSEFDILADIDNLKLPNVST